MLNLLIARLDLSVACETQTIKEFLETRCPARAGHCTCYGSLEAGPTSYFAGIGSLVGVDTAF
jgi:hypothetical protein